MPCFGLVNPTFSYNVKQGFSTSAREGTPPSQKYTHAQYATGNKKVPRRRCRIVRSVLILNNRTQFKRDQTFYLLIRNSSEDHQEAEYEPLYRLTAAPTTNQPGNGIVVLRPKDRVEFPEHGKKYSMLNAALKRYYKTNTKSSAKDIKKLLKRNTQK